MSVAGHAYAQPYDTRRTQPETMFDARIRQAFRPRTRRADAGLAQDWRGGPALGWVE